MSRPWCGHKCLLLLLGAQRKPQEGGLPQDFSLRSTTGNKECTEQRWSWAWPHGSGTPPCVSSLLGSSPAWPLSNPSRETYKEMIAQEGWHHFLTSLRSFSPQCTEGEADMQRAGHSLCEVTQLGNGKAGMYAPLQAPQFPGGPGRSHLTCKAGRVLETKTTEAIPRWHMCNVRV